MIRILYIGWVGHKNLGDDLMKDLFEINLKTIMKNKDYSLNYGFTVSDEKIENYDFIVLGGGSLIESKCINTLNRALNKGKKVMVWGTGVDRLKKTAIYNLNNQKNPFNKNFKAVLNRVANNAVYFGVRGPLTFNFLKQMGVEENKIEISGDPGLLLKPTKKIDPLKELKWDYKKENIVGINWGTSHNKIYGKDELLVEDQLVNACRILVEKGYKIFIYNVWPKDIKPCERLYNKIQDKENVQWSPTLYHQDELFSLMETFAFTVNFKLHPNVISAAANTPFIALGYRFKIFDFAKSIEMEDFVIPTDSRQIAKKILRLENNICSDRSSLLNKFNHYRDIYEKKLLSSMKVFYLE
ncbi:polysaccharide pyruvyl transferase family protein [Peribacillus asahii]|uniref:polysaccharide pyruvyl transferase family protein n=1 Tax=Peribacillus asahii TaxID=228899 RepID=UPI003816DC5A